MEIDGWEILVASEAAGPFWSNQFWAIRVDPPFIDEMGAKLGETPWLRSRLRKSQEAREWLHDDLMGHRNGAGFVEPTETPWFRPPLERSVARAREEGSSPHVRSRDSELWLSALGAGDRAKVERRLRPTKSGIPSGLWLDMLGFYQGSDWLDLVRTLLARGADPKARSDEDGKSTLHAALVMASKGRRASAPAVIDLLLSAGADVDAVDDDLRTALVWATDGLACSAEVVARLIDAGARLDAAAREGRTPLHCATERGHFDAARVLVQRGAPTGMRDHGGAIALDLARRWDHKKLVALLSPHAPSAGALEPLARMLRDYPNQYPRRTPPDEVVSAASAALVDAAAHDPSLTLATAFEGRSLLDHVLDYDLPDGLRLLATRDAPNRQTTLDEALAHHASRAPLALLEALLDAGASADVLGSSGYPFYQALTAGKSDAARLLFSRMRSTTSIRDAIGDALLAPPRTAGDPLQEVVVALAVALGIEPPLSFLECSRDGQIDPATARGLVPLVTMAPHGTQDPFAKTLRAVLVPLEPSRLAAAFADQGADVRADAARRHVWPPARALALLAFRDVPWTAIRPFGSDAPDVHKLAAMLAEKFSVSTFSVFERLVARHEPDGTDEQIAAHALSTPTGPFLPRHVLDTTRHSVRLHVKGIRPHAIERVDVIVLEPAPAAVLSDADRELVDAIVARVSAAAKKAKGGRKR